MAKKRLRYIEDLYDFYSNKYKRSTKFSAEKTGEPLVVQVHGRINFDESDKNKDGLLPVHLQSCHTDLNVNGSNIESSVMEAALPSFSNRPILGYIHKVTTDENPEGQWEFYSHNMHEDENGDVVYDEYPIDVSRPAAKDNDTYLTPGGFAWIKIFLRWICPVLIVVCGCVIWVMRRMK